MLHDLKPEPLQPFADPMMKAVQACVHCGFCLADCPTYKVMGQEADSPRGRIVLMKNVLEGSMDLEDAAPHLDACLGCLACEPACPSGVKYRDLISPFRALTEKNRRRPLFERLRRFLVSQSLPYPGRFRIAARAGMLTRPLRPLLPASMRPMLDLLPETLPPRQTWPEVSPARGKRRARVALLAGCAQQVLDPDINTATIEVLTRNGVEVLLPKGQACCGALAWHIGNPGQAKKFARQNIAAFPDDVDAIITNAAGCGSGLHEYPLMLAGTELEEEAAAFAGRVTDITSFLDELDELAEIPDSGISLKIAYQDACHLSHGQNVRTPPRNLIAGIPGVTLAEIADPHLCCGSAGTYNIDKPDIAFSLGELKAKAILAVEPDLVASGNIGCLTQIRTHLAHLQSKVQARHTIQILRDAYEGRLGTGD